MQDQLARAKVRVDAAEEDAQAAIDLASNAATSKQEIESWLQQALEEVTLLREQLESIHVNARSGTVATPKKNSVRFAESPTIVTVPNRDGVSRYATPPRLHLHLHCQVFPHQPALWWLLGATCWLLSDPQSPKCMPLF
jgi:hypothetical protein